MAAEGPTAIGEGADVGDEPLVGAHQLGEPKVGDLETERVAVRAKQQVVRLLGGKRGTRAARGEGQRVGAAGGLGWLGSGGALRGRASRGWGWAVGATLRSRWTMLLLWR